MASTLRLVAIIGGMATLTFGLLVLGCGRTSNEPDSSAPGANRSNQLPIKLGLSVNDPKAFDGYTLIAPVKSTTTYLIDMQGRVVHSWASDCTPALGACLLDDGHLLRTGLLPGTPASTGAGAGGRIQEFDWEGKLVWDFKFSNERQLPHHDITKLTNGNILVIVWERKTAKEAIAAGRRPDLVDAKAFLVDCLIEIKPTGRTGGQIVWEWHLWDHVIQDHDPSKANYGNVAEHPELVDLNFGENVIGQIAATKGGIEKLNSIGYVGSGAPTKPSRINPDWSHFNSVAYNAELDQIAVTSLAFGEFWIIDHGTTKAEAAGHRGGRGGKGGDLLYRWGNSRAYRAGATADQKLFAAHYAHWIPRGLPGEGQLLVFNNGSNRPDGSYSSVDELVLPVDSQGRYSRPPAAPFGPDQPAWSYSAPNKAEFYSMLLSGAQRLPNGNTLICSGSNGTLLEATPEKEVVWKYVNPTKGGYGPGGSNTGGFGPPGGGSLFRAHRFAKDHPGLAGKELKPGKTIEEILRFEAEATMPK